MRRNLFALVFAAALASFAPLGAAPTSITLDGSLGPGGTLSASSPGFYQITPAMGKTVGPNLFQSFGQFNLGTGDTAFFGANPGTQNVIARVTGGTPSSIDGTVACQAPNLFFLNPAGVMFGANAQVNVSGAFTVTTANYLKLSDGSYFYADAAHPLNDAGLTSAPVSAFGFLNATPQPVTFSGSRLGLNTGSGFNVIAGDVTFDNAQLVAPAGTETIFSAASAGEVPFSLSAAGAGFGQATTAGLGNVTLKNASALSVNSAQGGGKIVIRGGHMVVQDASAIAAGNFGGTGPGGTIAVQAHSLTVTGENSFITTATNGPGTAGNLSVTASDAVTVSGGGLISSFSTGAGRAGDISVQAASLTVDGTGAPGFQTGIVSSAYDLGAGGNVSVSVSDGIVIQTEGRIGASTFGSGNAGNVTVQAGSILMNGANSNMLETGITSDVEPLATGHGGNVLVTTSGSVSIADTAQISASTYSSGDAGNISLDLGSLEIGGSGTAGVSTGVTSNVFSIASGRGGGIDITTQGALIIEPGGSIAANTYSSADAGHITVHAGSMSITGSDTVMSPTGIFSEAHSPLGTAATTTGAAGAVEVDVTGALSILGDAQIDSNTTTSGNAGNVTVSAQALTIDGAATSFGFCGISSSTGELDLPSAGTGNGGLLTVAVTGQLILADKGRIASDSFSYGNGGDIVVEAGSLTVDGSASVGLITGISADTLSIDAGSTGNAGSITAHVTGAILLVGPGQIDTNTFTAGQAGNITLTGGSLSINDIAAPTITNGILSEALAGTGDSGNISISIVGGTNIISAGSISAATYTTGRAGNITVTTGSLLLDGTQTPGAETSIVSGSEGLNAGDSGNVTVTATGAIHLVNGGSISASTFGTGNAGNVTVRGGSLQIDGPGIFNDFTGLASSTNPSATGNGGDITVAVTGALNINGGAEITSTAFNTGNAGTISIHAGSVTLDGTASGGPLTGILTAAAGDSPDIFANAGAITIDVTGRFRILNSAEVSTDTLSSGNAGDITVRAGTLDIDGTGTPLYDTGITSSSQSDFANATGHGGSIRVTARVVDLIGGGFLNVTTFTAGDAGNIVVHAGELRLDGNGVTGIQTGIEAEAFASGNAGGIAIDAGAVTVSNHAVIGSASANSNGGDTTITAGTLKLLDHGLINASAAGDGGNITLRIGDLLYASESRIRAEAGHDGGNITIEGSPQFVVLDQSTISANAVGRGGNITIAPQDFLNNQSEITATGATAGIITITSPDLDLSGSLLPLPNELVSDEDRLRESCVRSINHEFSSLVVVGRGGTETAPDELAPDFGLSDGSLPQ